jgi:hypothetical protein
VEIVLKSVKFLDLISDLKKLQQACGPIWIVTHTQDIVGKNQISSLCMTTDCHDVNVISIIFIHCFSSFYFYKECKIMNSCKTYTI